MVDDTDKIFSDSLFYGCEFFPKMYFLESFLEITMWFGADYGGNVIHWSKHILIILLLLLKSLFFIYVELCACVSTHFDILQLHTNRNVFFGE